ncbi:MAG: phosphoribosylanthranilate isomerase, partial [Sediminibacterium sp.]
MQFKVCGITNINQAITLETMGVDYIGFIFYAPSKRYVLNALTLEAIKNFKPRNAKKVGVFVNETLELVMSMVQTAGLD